MVWFKSRKAKAEEKKQDTIYTRWEQDYNLADQPKMGLFDEYLEMGKQKIQFICTFKEVVKRDLLTCNLVQIKACYMFSKQKFKKKFLWNFENLNNLDNVIILTGL